ATLSPTNISCIINRLPLDEPGANPVFYRHSRPGIRILVGQMPHLRQGEKKSNRISQPRIAPGMTPCHVRAALARLIARLTLPGPLFDLEGSHHTAQGAAKVVAYNKMYRVLSGREDYFVRIIKPAAPDLGDIQSSQVGLKTLAIPAHGHAAGVGD